MMNAHIECETIRYALSLSFGDTQNNNDNNSSSGSNNVEPKKNSLFSILLDSIRNAWGVFCIVYIRPFRWWFEICSCVGIFADNAIGLDWIEFTYMKFVGQTIRWVKVFSKWIWKKNGTKRQKINFPTSFRWNIIYIKFFLLLFWLYLFQSPPREFHVVSKRLSSSKCLLENWHLFG